MCGIAGILTHSISSDRLYHSIQSMQAALRHRGPDDAGIYYSADRQVALAHTRLAILDLSPAGHQPMSTPDGRYWITFNGEIYNFQELRSKLETQGIQFQSRTDTEVILRLYELYGVDCLNYLRGMFAFAIWDDWQKVGFLARDPLGIKPLYYWQSDSTLVFASELRAVLASGLPSKQLSPAGLYGYLTTGSVPEPYTLIDQLYLLKAGHYLQWQAGKAHQQLYWKIQFKPQEISPIEATATVRTALIDSIQHHFISDVPVGVFLSGGIDSTAIVALARQTQTGPLHTCSITFEEAQWNEGDLARQVAAEFNTEHTELMVTASTGRSLLSKYLSAIDQPSIDGFNTFCVSQLACESGMKVALSGLGGDELFGGYRSFQIIPRMLHISQKLKSLKPIKTAIGIGLERYGQSPQLRRLGDFFQQSHSTETAYRSFRGIFSHWEACQILKTYVDDNYVDNLELLSHQIDHPPELLSSSPADEISWLELSRYMRNQLLRDSDVMSMAWGLELRVPMVDQVLLDTIATIPAKIRLASRKHLLTQAVPEIPDWVKNRPKQGFDFPYEQWLQAEWRDYFQQFNLPNSILLKSWYRRWSLLMLQHWCQENI